jgi:thiol-disulfide isomerase/thioredoxin
MLSEGQTVKALTVGDKVPDIVFTNVLNYKTSTAKLSDFKGKSIILDFWATNCSACIYKLPMLDSMQHLYRSQLSVILIGSSDADTKNKVDKIMSRIATTEKHTITLVSVIGDTIANDYFPHIYVPHYAWLNDKGKVAAVTGSEDVTPQKIAQFIEGKPVKFSLKEDITNFNPEQLLFVNGNGGSGASIQSRSLLCGYIPGLPSGSYITKDSTGLYSKILQTNQPILYLLMRAYDYFYDPKRFHFPTGSNSDIRLDGKSEEWVMQNSYTYEQYMAAPLKKEKALQNMQEDIRRYLGYAAAIKKIPTDCFVITIDSLILAKYLSAGGRPVNNLAQPGDRHLQNRPLSDVAEFLDQLFITPVVDESGFDSRINLTLSDSDVKNFSSLKAALSRYGICLSKSTRLLDNFFIYKH